MIKYPQDYNPILEYWEKIEKGDEVVSYKIRQTYRKIVRDLNNQKEFFYDTARANHVIEFCENFCRHSKGKMGGKPVILELWEKAILATIFGFVDIDSNRKYREAMLIVAKKNGKSLIASCIGLYMQTADGEAGPEVYAVATKRDQSKIIWLESKRMVRKSPALLKRIKPLVAELDSDFNDGVFKPLASDSDTLDGLNVHCVLMDEIHQWKDGKTLYDIMADGVAAREQPLILITTTAGTIREDIYDLKYEEAKNNIDSYFDNEKPTDERSIAFIYELDKREEWTSENAWKKANPGLGTIKNITTLRDKVKKALANPYLVKNLVCKEFNIRETNSESWLNYEQLNNEATFDISLLKPKYGIGGVDLSSTTDLTNATIIFKVPERNEIFVEQMYWLPADLIERRTTEDKIPYLKWLEQGLLRTSPGNKINHSCVTEWFTEMQEKYGIWLQFIGYDSWNSQMWVDEMKGLFGSNTMIPVIQGAKTLSSPMKSLGADIEAKLVNYNNNPILKWCLANTVIEVDKNDNIRPIKGRNQRRRIDGLMGLLDAYTVLQLHYDEYINYI